MSQADGADGAMRGVRAAFARQMAAIAGGADAALEAAFARVPREAFLGPGPWRMRVMVGPEPRLREVPPDPVLACQDLLFELDPARGVNNGSPALHALLLHRLAPRPGETVLHAGAGTGYYSALLAELVGPSGRIVAVEADARLAAFARGALAPWPQVEVVEGDSAALPKAPLHRIYVSFGVGRLPAPWLGGLRPGGVLVVPLGLGRHGAALRLERRGAGFAVEWLGQAWFVAAEGALAAQGEAEAALRRAFEGGGVEAVRGLVRPGSAAAPERSWLWTADYALGFDPPPE